MYKNNKNHTRFFSIKALYSLIVFALIWLVSCDSVKPAKLAFVGPTTGRNSDLGIDGRNGFILAIEQFNQQGGIKSLAVEMVFKDDKQNIETGQQIFTEFSQEDIDIVIGPMTSAIGVSIVDIINQTKQLTISPTVTTAQLSGKDDYFFRVLSSTDIYATRSAQYLFANGVRTISIAYDLSNMAYTDSWKSYFIDAFENLGGQVLSASTFVSSESLSVSKITNDVTSKPADAVILVSNAIDAALIIQQIRKKLPQQMILIAEWAGTERLIELAGKHVNGVLIPQYIDRQSQQSEFLQFRKDYVERFNHEPGFPSITSYNATHTALLAIQIKQPDESLKQTLLRVGSFEGIQIPVKFDEYGDVQAQMFMVQVNNGKFVVK